MFDNLEASIHCPRCGHTSRSDESIGIQTHLREMADGSVLTLGHQFDENDLRNCDGYLQISPPRAAGDVALLNTWTCPSCEKEQWARVEIVAGRLTSISPVSMSAATFNAANYIGEVDAELLAAAVLGMDSLEFVEQQLDPVAVLRQRLPE